ncbi:MAG TPA: flagellar hook-basal body complex protein FliE [Bdellovibrionales bacterium]|nr:flagellar hook-basal body complex protein FliE [Bdellovibrionales bacterium]
MDGLKISTGNMSSIPIGGELTTGRTSTSQTQAPGTSTNVSGEGSFAQTLKDAVNSVDQLQKESDLKMQQLATGQNNNIHETMIAAEKADIALRLMVQVRNKIIEAYQEVMRMQV